MSPTFVVERAHRIPLTATNRGSSTFLSSSPVKYHDRDRILLAARVKDLQYENTKLLFFFSPDYPPEVQQQRQTFTEVRKRLRDKEIKFSLLYPSAVVVNLVLGAH